MTLSGHKVEFLRKALYVAATAIPLICVLVAPFVPGWPAKRFLVFYFAPIISMSAVWASVKIRSISRAPRTEVVIDSLVFSAAMARFFVGDAIPFSGHMLFFAYTLLTTKEKWYKALTILLILETTYFKLWVWSDFKTWANGLMLGVISGIVLWGTNHFIPARVTLNQKQVGMSEKARIK